MSTPTFTGNKNPYVTGGINKSLLTPCRRVGLSRKLKTPGSGAKLGISPLNSPLSGSACSTPVNNVSNKLEIKSSDVEAKKVDKRKTKKLVSKKLEMEEKPKTNSNIQTIKVINKSDTKSKDFDSDDEPLVKLGTKETRDQKPDLTEVNCNKNSDQKIKKQSKDSDSSDDEPLTKIVKVRALIEPEQNKRKYDELQPVIEKKQKNLNIILKKIDVVTNNQPEYQLIKKEDIETQESSSSSQEIKPKKIYKRVLDSDSDEDFQSKKITKTKRLSKLSTIKEKTSSLKIKKSNSVDLDIKNLKELHRNEPEFVSELDPKPLIVIQQVYDDDDDFTSSPRQDKLERDETLKKIRNIEESIRKKTEVLTKYKQVEVYKNKHNIEELNKLTKIWMEGCTKALNDLLKTLQTHGPIDMLGLLNKLHISTEVAKKLKVIE